jgi:hypothetical protein
MKFCVAFDKATLEAAIGVVPDGIEFGKTGFYIVEINDAHVAVFVVSPETLFEIDLVHFTLHSLQIIHQQLGVLLTPPVLLHLMQQIGQGSVMASKAAH